MKRALYLTTREMCDALEQFEGRPMALSSLARWSLNGWLVPSVQWENVRRVPKLYSVQDLARARLLVRLTRARLGTTWVHRVMWHIEQHAPDVLSEHTTAVLSVDRRTRQVLIGRPGRTVQELPGGNRQRLLPFEVQLADVAKGNRAFVERLRRAA